MVAYDDGTGGVAVLWADDPVPEGYEALEPGTYQDTALIELEAALQDIGTGLSSDCYDEAEARAKVQGELDRLGVDTWEVTVDESRRPDGIDRCASAALLSDQQAVWIFGNAGTGDSRDFGTTTEFAKALHAEMEAQCLNLDEAAELTQSLAAATPGDAVPGSEPTMIVDGLKIDRAIDPTASCTRVNVSIGGALFVVLRGPSA